MDIEVVVDGADRRLPMPGEDGAGEVFNIPDEGYSLLVDGPA
jgi:hypothetical protein